MSAFTCPNCGHETSIFGSNGALKIAREMNLDILGDVPLHLSIRETSDEGTPIVVAQPDSPQVLDRGVVAVVMILCQCLGSDISQDCI